MYASHPPPGKAVTAPLEANWAGGKIVLKYTDSLKCLNTYSAKVDGDKLIGTYAMQNCGDKDESGEFYAEQHKRAAMPNNGMQRTRRTALPSLKVVLRLAADAGR
jgi:hypothetical protein